ncbi:unnamed protein product [Closterium sp. NIES-54]
MASSRLPPHAPLLSRGAVLESRRDLQGAGHGDGAAGGGEGGEGGVGAQVGGLGAQTPARYRLPPMQPRLLAFLASVSQSNPSIPPSPSPPPTFSGIPPPSPTFAHMSLRTRPSPPHTYDLPPRPASPPGCGAVCEYVHSGQAGGRAYVAMELLGPSLSDLRRSHPHARFPVATLVPLALQMLKALRTMHDHGFLHRDVKPVSGPLTLPHLHRLAMPTCDQGAKIRFS